MRPAVIKQARGLKGEFQPSGDKSITHRAVILSSITPGKTILRNFPANKDCLATVNAFRKLGVRILPVSAKTLAIYGRGFLGLKEPRTAVFVGDSGTTLRLLLGVLAGQPFQTTLTAGTSLSKRPMLRVTLPLRLMDAKIKASIKKAKEEFPPITIRGGVLKPITYRMPVASAQVKSAILLAGLYARGKTRVIEPTQTRDHTERMLRLFGAAIKVLRSKAQTQISVDGAKQLSGPKSISIPGDISSASFFLAASAILPDSHLALKNVSLNPSRTGIIRVLKRMNADIRIKPYGLSRAGSEPAGDILVRGSILKATTVKRQEVPNVIDELPVLMVAACYARGTSVFEGVGELRVKETDRVQSMVENLTRMGADIRVEKTANLERIVIKGRGWLKGARVKSYSDHRTAMSLVVAGLAAEGKTSIDDVSCIAKSFPEFLRVLKPLIRQ